MHAGTIRQGDNIAAIMQDLLLKGVKAGPDGRISVYDMAMGTGLMLSAVVEKAGEMCPKAHVVCCGQEKDPHKYILAKAAAMLKGLDHDYAEADVIPEDRFVGQTFSLGVTGFPVETNWGKNAKEVIEEYKAIPFGRFQPGLPSVSDVQVLYLLNGISKMADGGKMAIVMTDDALLDPRAKEMENIRKYVLGNDLIETIVRTKAKPKIRKFSCIYLLNKKKLAKRRGKVQNINIESEMVEGKDIVLQAYKEFRNRVYEDGENTIESRICSTRYILETPEDAYSQTMEMLREHPEIDSLFITCGCVPDICSAVRDYRAEVHSDVQPVIICYEKYPEIITLIKNNEVACTLNGGLTKQGRFSMRVLFEYLVYDRRPEKKRYYFNNKILIRENL
jgi:hypothetical protein